jgi:hypothetical protein
MTTWDRPFTPVQLMTPLPDEAPAGMPLQNFRHLGELSPEMQEWRRCYRLWNGYGIAWKYRDRDTP